MLRTSGRTGRQLWAERVAATPDRLFLVDVPTGRRWSYAQAEEEVARTAGGLADLGVRPGERVLVGTGNHAHTVFSHLAVARVGAVCIPLQPGLTFAELHYQVQHSAGSVLLADGAVAETLNAHLVELAGVSSLRTVVVDHPDAVTGLPSGRALDVRSSTALQGTRLPYQDIDGYDVDSLATILYTSGSTGRPKGVMIPAGAFGAAGRAFAQRFGVSGQDVYYLPLTLAHAIGALTAQAMTVVTGGGLALADRFSPSRFWSDIADSGATCSILFPAHLNLVLEASKSESGNRKPETTLRLVITHQFLRAFRDRFGVELATVWGMTETGAMSSGSDPGEVGADGYVGRTMAGVELGIFDDGGRRLRPGELGEIRLRHRHVMLGYLDDAQATAATLVDGWVRSGDFGTVDEDGRLYFRGRQKNMIKRSGENISPEEVEGVLAEDPRVREALVFGVPDPIRTEEVAAVVVLGAPASTAELIDAAGSRLVRWKLPRYVRLTVEPLPRLGNGKIDRARVRSTFAGTDYEDRARLNRDAPAAFVAEL